MTKSDDREFLLLLHNEIVIRISRICEHNIEKEIQEVKSINKDDDEDDFWDVDFDDDDDPFDVDFD